MNNNNQTSNLFILFRFEPEHNYSLFQNIKNKFNNNNNNNNKTQNSSSSTVSFLKHFHNTMEENTNNNTNNDITNPSTTTTPNIPSVVSLSSSSPLTEQTIV